MNPWRPDGIVADKMPDSEGSGKMALNCVDSEWLHDDPNQAAHHVLSFVKGDPPEFVFFGSILETPTWHRLVFAELSSARPDLSLLDPYSFFLLLRLHSRQ